MLNAFDDSSTKKIAHTVARLKYQQENLHKQVRQLQHNTVQSPFVRTAVTGTTTDHPTYPTDGCQIPFHVHDLNFQASLTGVCDPIERREKEESHVGRVINGDYIPEDTEILFVNVPSPYGMRYWIWPVGKILHRGTLKEDLCTATAMIENINWCRGEGPTEVTAVNDLNLTAPIGSVVHFWKCGDEYVIENVEHVTEKMPYDDPFLRLGSACDIEGNIATFSVMKNPCIPPVWTKQLQMAEVAVVSSATLALNGCDVSLSGGGANICAFIAPGPPVGGGVSGGFSFEIDDVLVAPFTLEVDKDDALDPGVCGLEPKLVMKGFQRSVLILDSTGCTSPGGGEITIAELPLIPKDVVADVDWAGCPSSIERIDLTLGSCGPEVPDAADCEDCVDTSGTEVFVT